MNHKCQLWYDEKCYNPMFHLRTARTVEDLLPRSTHPNFSIADSIGKTNLAEMPTCPNPLGSISKSRLPVLLDNFRERFKWKKRTGSDLIPPWLYSDEFRASWPLLDRTFAIMPPLTMAGQLNWKSIGESKREKVYKGPGEHFLHCLVVMSIGHHLLREHYVDWDGKRMLLRDAIMDWCAKDIRASNRKACKQKFGCRHALMPQCIDFIWQLIALLHDVGFHGVFLHHALCLLSAKAGKQPVYPGEFMTDAAGTLRSDREFSNVCKTFRAIFKDDPVAKYVGDYVSDNNPEDDPDHFSWYGHAIYSGVIIHCFKEYMAKGTSKSECGEYIYKWIERAIAKHHFPSSSLRTWEWQFKRDPFAYLLRVVDETPILRAKHKWKELQNIQRKLTSSGFSITFETKENRFRIEPAVREKTSGPLKILCCPKDRGEGSYKCDPCYDNLGRGRYCRSETKPKFQEWARTQLSEDSMFPVIYPLESHANRKRS